MEQTALNRIVNNIASQCMNPKTPGYFECLEALDMLEFHILDRIAPSHQNRALITIRDRAECLHAELTSTAQAVIDNLIHDIRTRQFTPSALKALFNQFAHSVEDESIQDEPDYDLFDDFLSHLFQVEVEPSETRSRTDEMVYQQPTPGRIILEVINELPLTRGDTFFDLGSGLGRVPILVSLLTDAYTVGIEYEPTYVEYSRYAAQKLGVSNVEFRNLDAQDAALSDGTVFFMYTPFTGSILRKVLSSLRDLSKQQSITLCTYGPCTPIIEEETWLYSVRHSEGEIHRLAILSSLCC